MAVRSFCVFLSRLRPLRNFRRNQLIGPVFGTGPIAVITVYLWEKSIYLQIGKSAVAINKSVSMPCLTFVSFFIIHTPIQRSTTDIGHNVYDFFMGETVLLRIVYGDHPFTGLSHILWHKTSSIHMWKLHEIQKYKNTEKGGNTDPPFPLLPGVGGTQQERRGKGKSLCYWRSSTDSTLPYLLYSTRTWSPILG